MRVNATQVVTFPEETTGKGTPKKRRFDVWDAARAARSQELPTPEAAYRVWLSRQLAGAAAVDAVGLVGREEMRVSRGMDRDDARTRRIRLVFAELVGSLTVEDPARLLETVVSGVGRGRAFGCGLLLLWPAGALPRATRREP